MGRLPHWTRGEKGERIFTEIPDTKETESIKERIDDIVLEKPYFEQAAQSILFLKDNTASYPNTMKSLRKVDDELIAEGKYKELTEGQKAKILVEEVKSNLKI